jgi:hypothetical protein
MSSLWFQAARIAVVCNAAILVGLAYTWARNYRAHGASHTLGLLVFALLLLAQNLLAVYLYNFHATFHGWVGGAAPVAQRGMMALNVLELLAIVFLARITWQ